MKFASDIIVHIVHEPEPKKMGIWLRQVDKT